jgi:hypothetical protein
MNEIVTCRQLTRLRPGDVIDHAGAEHVVALTNECRAHCLPLQPEIRMVRFRGRDTIYKMVKYLPGIDISPNSETEILRTITPRQLRRFIRKRQKKPAPNQTQAGMNKSRPLQSKPLRHSGIDSKSGVRVTVPWVRLPPLPPIPQQTTDSIQ